MKKIYNILIVLLFIPGAVSFGQSNTETKPFIEVSGSNEKQVAPNEIYISFSLRDRSVGRTKITVAEQEEKLKKLVDSLSLPLENLGLSDVNSGYVRVAWGKQGVQNKREYTLKVSNASEAGSVFDGLEEMQVTNGRIAKVTHSALDSLKKEVRIAAIKDAKEKADYMLEAIGEKTGKPIIVKDEILISTVYSSDLTVRGARALPRSSIESVYIDGIRAGGGSSYPLIQRDSYKVEPEPPKEIEFEKITIRSSVYVKFLIL